LKDRFGATYTFLGGLLSQKVLLLFVHGLGGDQTTWGQFPELLTSDAALSKNIDIAFYGYPTRRIRLPWSKQSNRIQDLGRAVRTEFGARFHSYSKVIIIAHSLGGLIAQKYLIEELKEGLPLKVAGLLLFAVPSAGAKIATWGDRISFRHFHLRQLRKHSETLESINGDWRALNCDTKVNVVWVYGGQDSIVQQIPNPNCKIEFIADEDHQSIVKPKSDNSTSFLIVRNFVLGHLELKGAVSSASVAAASSTDVLFDVYRPELDRFYIERREDRILRSYITRQNIWLFGPSGLGKTAALTRCLTQSSSFRLISLGHYAGCTVKELFVALHEALGGTQSKELVEWTWPKLIEALCDEINALCSSGLRWIFVEEMPLGDSQELSEFLARLSSLLILQSKSRSFESISFAFSSINDPRLDVRDLHRVSQILKVIRFSEWRHADLEKLMQMILNEISVELSPLDQGAILAASGMSPRFMKVFFTNYVSLLPMMREPRAALEEALVSTKSELDR
jgi:hypothetical protein